MKKILTLLLVLVLSLSVMVGCDKIPGLGDFELPNIGDLMGGEHEHNFVDGECECGEKDPNYTPAPETDADLKLAYDYVHQLIKTTPEKTVADYTLVLVAPVGEKNYTVTWEIIGTDLVTINGDTVVIPEAGDADVNYTLKFTVTNEKGETLSKEYAHVVPKFAVNTYAEYAAAEVDAPLVVEGVVYGIMSKENGDKENSVFVQDLNNAGGYYLYAVSDEVIAQAVIGQTVRVKGNKAIYNGTLELKNATIEVLSTETVTVTPTDLTEVFTNATSAEDANLLATLGGYVTIKGVTVLEAGDNGYYYFELDGVKTYLRISSSSNCSSSDDEKKIVKNHGDKFYYAAEVTGIAAIYNKAFYIMPVDANAFSNFSEEMQPMPDDVKAKFILDKLSVTSEMVTTDPVTLPLVGTSVVNMSVFENVNIAWTLAETSNATLVDGVLTAVLPTEPGSVNITLTATVTVNNTTETKDFTVAVKNVAPISITEANTIASGKEHNTYTESGYVVEGIISEIANGKYGNVYIEDAEGNKLYVYGIYSVYGVTRFDKLESAPKVGDKVVLYGILGTYNDANQMKNAWLLSWEHIHNYTEQGETVEPTCAQGYTVYSCYCGETEKRDFTDAVAEHVISENTFFHPELVQATCTTPGVAVFECDNCDYYYTEATAIDPDGHNFLDWECESEVISPADCTTETNGVEKVKCLYCDATENQEIHFYTAHEWNTTVDTYATCTEDGEFHRICTICNVEETEDRPATGHYNWYLACETTGACLECGEEFTNAHEGNPATCTEAAFCFKCWSSYGEPLGHDWDENDPASVCSRCGLSNHTCDFSVAGDIVAPTCTEGGYTVYGCSVDGCNATENKDETAATNHEGTTEDKEAVAPTCSEVGYTAGVWCTACQTWVSGHEEQAIVADAHKNENGDAFCDNGCNTIVNYGTLEAPLTATQADAVASYFESIYTEENIYSEQKFYVTGTVTAIGSTGSYYKNVYITDGTTSLLIYSINMGEGISGFTKGDVITAYGYIAYAYGTKEITGKGSDYTYALTVVAHTCDFSAATCTEASKCTICGATGDEDALGHTTTDGICGNCGETISSNVKYNKVTSADQLSTGTYVLIVETKNITVSTFDGSWIKGSELSPADSFDKATGDALAITLEVTDAGVKIKIGDQYVAPKGGNNNGIKAGEYVWAYEFQDDGSVIFAGTGSDTVYLAYNAGSAGFRGYKTSTVTGSGYPHKFTIYKLG